MNPFQFYSIPHFTCHDLGNFSITILLLNLLLSKLFDDYFELISFYMKKIPYLNHLYFDLNPRCLTIFGQQQFKLSLFNPKDLLLIRKFICRMECCKRKLVNGQIIKRESSKSWALSITTRC